ncbi:hypothetical protein BKP37_04520 [Anaerobacillus alkalilacustris]|uniref:Methionine aminopeptidase n=1 Tax=Anaerobacillus alkalilacustris TaxID=393763 RepID=A0A1S2LX80_9BACI|nr:hypothetical protein [Anaerobacillus alkalilacustris]OIJ16800.1 hypothetical protein BKP37_04520 [Anaerobacillus alkalilacustris]
MGIFNHFFDMIAANREKKLEKMRDQGICPECRGKGYHAPIGNAYVYMPSFDYRCYSCNGTGSFNDWENQTHSPT